MLVSVIYYITRYYVLSNYVQGGFTANQQAAVLQL